MNCNHHDRQTVLAHLHASDASLQCSMSTNTSAATSVAPLLYSLEDSCPVAWPESAEAQRHHDYPIPEQDDCAENFVIRRYLETLWLPESFNPLSHLISSLRRISPPSNESLQVHPLHSLLEPLLLSARAASDKYRTELVQILADGGGAEDREETMMWYAWTYEKVDDEGNNETDEGWRRAWLERLERREAMIQILLYMLKLSLSGPNPSRRDSTSKKKKRSKRGISAETDEERMESYMDKMSVWQLTTSLTGTMKDRHWTQEFFEDVVEPLFNAELPEYCELFRSKLYPESVGSDTECSEAETLSDKGNSCGVSRAPSVKPAAAPTVPILQRSRSLSLSMSLARDEASQRAIVIGQKRMLSREVSMSRAFKEKPKTRSKANAPREQRQAKPEKSKTKRDVGITLVQETPTKPKRTTSAASGELELYQLHQTSDVHLAEPSQSASSSSGPGDAFIGDTPLVVRKRRAKTRT